MKSKIHEHKKNNFTQVSKKVFLAMAIACSLTLFAQTEEKSKKITVPANVKEAFAKDFPENKAKWEMEDGDYEAHLKINGSDASAIYDKKGHRKAVELTVATSELPLEVLEYVKKKYPTSKIVETAKTTDDKNTVTYEAAIGKNGKTFDLIFDSNGKFIKIVEAD